MKIKLSLVFAWFGVLLLLLPTALVEAQGGRGIEMFLKVDKSSAEAGELISGKVTARVYNVGSDTAFALILIFGDGTRLTLGSCTFNEDLAEKFTECDFNFIHIYDTPKIYNIRVEAVGGPMPHIWTISGPQQEIAITERTGPGFATSIQPAIEATSTAAIINKVIEVAIWIIGSLLVLLIMIGGFTILTAAGSPQQVSKGKKIIIYSIIGFAIMAVSRGIIAFVYLILGIDIP